MFLLHLQTADFHRHLFLPRTVGQNVPHSVTLGDCEGGGLFGVGVEREGSGKLGRGRVKKEGGGLVREGCG